ncbi:MAG: hypothetical protein GWO00_01465, partial [Gemmatimonadetes bacterium]|nr:hypothetical protein [Gemmatimonadota bacterium]NIR77096.1 hypothetical protein [Gemmatimonadota bacterium]NIT85614.1 hypothetical protein [Gemmatimonadota bacterium]NIU29448.1 hypothetical protein [Gemmatimonadota bacterium]NIV59862.1 hypothetical protein [Gemmatimonadota bacterium]
EPEPPGPTGEEAGPTEEEAGAPPVLRFGEFAVFGGGGEGIELRVRIEADGEVHEATLGLEDLDALDATAFVHATLRAAESALDARPAGRSGRILLLDPVDVEETGLREGSFAAVTVEARLRHGRRRATGFARLRGSLRETSARAALDAVSRLVDGRSAAPPAEAPSPRDASRPIDPFDVWD